MGRTFTVCGVGFSSLRLLRFLLLLLLLLLLPSSPFPGLPQPTLIRLPRSLDAFLCRHRDEEEKGAEG